MEIFDVKIEVKSKLKDELMYAENETLSVIKFRPKEDDDDTHVEKSNNTLMKNNSCVWPCTSFESDVLKIEVQNNIVKEEPEDFSNEEHKKGLIQDSQIEITESDIKNESDNISSVEKVKTETVLKDGDIVKESDLNINRHCLEQNKNTTSLSSCEYINREINYEKIHKSNLKRDLKVHTEESNFLCKLCNKKFFTKQSLNRHIISMHSENKKIMNLKKMYKCSLCEYKSASNTCFIHHMNVHKSAKIRQTYQCNKCDFISVYESSLKRHCQIHTDERHFQCQTCDKKFRTKRNLDIHIVSKHPENKEMMDNVTNKINKCNMCEYKTILISSFKIHVQRHESAKRQILQCDICDYKTIISENLKRHIQHHSSERRFTCQICNKSCFRKEDLDGHIVSMHSENRELMNSITRKIYQCSICKYKTVSISCFKMHVQRHKSVKTKPTYQCDICGHKTLVKTDLIRHIQVHTGERSFYCRFCDKKFLRKRSLDVHIISKHSENKELMNSITSKIHKCDICTYKTVSRSAFKIHGHTHKRDVSERPFPCQICDKTCFRKVDLESQIVSKHSENKEMMDNITCKINKCTMCEYKTISNSCFKIHLQRHKSITMEPTYQCDICGHKTLVKKDLIRHIQVHTRERSFLCEFCDKTFLRKQTLDVHIVSKHSENEELMNSITSKIHKCDICEYQTVSSYVLKVHVQIHKPVPIQSGGQF